MKKFQRLTCKRYLLVWRFETESYPLLPGLKRPCTRKLAEDSYSGQTRVWFSIGRQHWSNCWCKCPHHMCTCLTSLHHRTETNTSSQRWSKLFSESLVSSLYKWYTHIGTMHINISLDQPYLVGVKITKSIFRRIQKLVKVWGGLDEFLFLSSRWHIHIW